MTAMVFSIQEWKALQSNFPSHERIKYGRMKHPKVIRNFNIKQWFCTTCGRTSDHVNLDDARLELDQYECQVPYVEAPETAPGEETIRLMKKPFKMVPKNKEE